MKNKLYTWLSETFNSYYLIAWCGNNDDGSWVVIEHLPNTPHSKFYSLLKKLIPDLDDSIVTNISSEGCFGADYGEKGMLSISGYDNEMHHTHLLEED